MDETDLRILEELSVDCRKKIKNLAKKLGFPKSTVHNRIKKMEEQGIIIGYRALIDYEKIGKGGTAFVNIVATDNEKAEIVVKSLVNDPRVEDVCTVTGSYDIVAKVRFGNIKEMASFLFKAEGGSPRGFKGVQKTETEIVLSTYKEFGIPKIVDLSEEEIKNHRKKVS